MDVRKIPVFVFPNTLKFYVGSKQSHKQLITVYNPYEMSIRYQVLCTAPNKFNVSEPEGTIRPQSCMDIVIRHLMPISANSGAVDKFRITIHDNTTKQILGRRDVETRLMMGEPDNNSEDGDTFHAVSRHIDSGRSQTPIQEPPRNVNSDRTNYIAIFVGVVCIGLLMFPTKYEPRDDLETFIPPYLHPTSTFKLGVAFFLGLLASVIFRQ